MNVATRVMVTTFIIVMSIAGINTLTEAGIACSSPMSYGWVVSDPQGNCLPYENKNGLIVPYYLAAGEYVIDSTGYFHFCPANYSKAGCVIR